MRRGASSLLAAATALALVLAGAAAWTSQTLFGTDRFVAAVGPVIDQQPVREALVTEVSAQVASLINVPAAAALVQREVRGLVEAPSFRPVWLNGLRLAHGQLLAALTGPAGADPTLRTSGPRGSVVRLDLIGVVAQALQHLPPAALALLGTSGQLRGSPATSPSDLRAMVGRFLGRPLPSDFATVDLMPVSKLDTARTYAGWLDGSAPGLFAVAVVLLLLALALSRRKLRTIAEVGLWLALFTLVAYVVVRSVGTAVVGALPLGPAQPVGVAVVAALFDSLRSQALTLTVVAAVAAVAAFVLSSGSRARMREPAMAVARG